MLNVTSRAHCLIDNALEKERRSPDEKLYVRLSIGIGWGSPQLKLSLEEQPITDDEIIEYKNIQYIIQKRDLVYFEQTKLDYVKDVYGNGKFKLFKG